MANEHHEQPQIRIGSVVLWAVAFVLTALVIMQAGRLAPNPAYAGMATTTDQGFSLVTSSSGLGPKDAPYDLLYVIDNRQELLYIYTIPTASNQAASRLELLGGGSLPTLFNAARR
ncbi:MAG: hypothetical protein MK085_00570 [Phycisphaerales bacterium]|nr:hypothetical protein [Phycisphaerales bacterium]